MSKFKIKNSLGIIVASIGIGIILAIVIPVVGWILAVGGGLIFLGWYLIEYFDK